MTISFYMLHIFFETRVLESEECRSFFLPRRTLFLKKKCLKWYTKKGFRRKGLRKNGPQKMVHWKNPRKKVAWTSPRIKNPHGKKSPRKIVFRQKNARKFERLVGRLRYI